jgi:hypothetical protein
MKYVSPGIFCRVRRLVMWNVVGYGVGSVVLSLPSSLLVSTSVPGTGKSAERRARCCGNTESGEISFSLLGPTLHRYLVE